MSLWLGCRGNRDYRNTNKSFSALIVSDVRWIENELLDDQPSSKAQRSRRETWLFSFSNDIFLLSDSLRRCLRCTEMIYDRFAELLRMSVNLGDRLITSAMKFARCNESIPFRIRSTLWKPRPSWNGSRIYRRKAASPINRWVRTSSNSIPRIGKSDIPLGGEISSLNLVCTPPLLLWFNIKFIGYQWSIQILMISSFW